VGGRQGPGDRGYLLAVHEDLDVRPDRVALVDHAEAQPRVTPVEVGEELADGRAFGLDLAALRGVAGERGGKQHFHFAAAVSTEKISGRCRHRHCQLSPSSALVHTSPLVVPKYRPTGSKASAAIAWRFTVNQPCAGGRPASC